MHHRDTSTAARHVRGLALAACALLAAALPAAAKQEYLPADPVTRDLLRDEEFQAMALSPDGSLLAMARRYDATRTHVIVNRLSDMKAIIQFDPGNFGEITSLTWVDNQRLMVGMTQLRAMTQTAGYEPVLVIANVDGSKPWMVPGNFFATVEGDPEHILVYDCRDACTIPQIRRDEVTRLRKAGELLIEGPKDTGLMVNRTATAGFAFGTEDDDTTRTHVYNPADKTWKLINDSSQTGVTALPIMVSKDGKTGYLRTERKAGADVIERYDFATGQRTTVFQHPESDPRILLQSFDGLDVVGAYFGATEPKPHFWLTEHPDAKALAELYASFPGQLVTRVSVTKDQNLMILRVSSDREAGVYYLYDRRARKARPLARRAPWLEAKDAASQRPFSLAARDGTRLHGVLTLPPGKESARQLPMVVVPHGGPHGVVDTWGFDREAQILARHGYAVLQVNFRGSGGYGLQFMEKGYLQWDRAMQDDVTDATRWAIADGLADPKRICIYGASYGGFAALMGPIREPGLYQCAAGLAGVFDLAKMYKWGSIRRSDLGQRYLKRVLGEDKADLAARSPAQLADRIGVPVLLAHGYLDGRVDVKHAQLMDKQLRKRRHAVEYIEYSRAGHGLAIDRDREDFYARLLRFLDQHIGEGRAAAGGAAAGAAPAAPAAPAAAAAPAH